MFVIFGLMCYATFFKTMMMIINIFFFSSVFLYSGFQMFLFDFDYDSGNSKSIDEDISKIDNTCATCVHFE